MTRKKLVRTAFDESVAAADWITPHHSALVVTGRRLATAIDGTEDAAYGSLSRLALEFRQCLKALGLHVGEEPIILGDVVKISPLERIRDSM